MAAILCETSTPLTEAGRQTKCVLYSLFFNVKRDLHASCLFLLLGLAQLSKSSIAHKGTKKSSIPPLSHSVSFVVMTGAQTAA